MHQQENPTNDPASTPRPAIPIAADETLAPAPRAPHTLEWSGKKLEQYGVAPEGDRTFVWSYVRTKDGASVGGPVARNDGDEFVRIKGGANLHGFIVQNERGDLGLSMRKYPSVGSVLVLPDSAAIPESVAREAAHLHSGPPSAGLTSESFHLLRAPRSESVGYYAALAEAHLELNSAVKCGVFVDFNVYAALYHLRIAGEAIPAGGTPEVDLARLGEIAQRNADTRTVAKNGFVFQILEADGQEYASRKKGACAAIVLTVTAENEVVFVEQKRPPCESDSCKGITIECPAGMVGDSSQLEGEDPAAAGIREVIEEAGYKPARMRNLLLCPSTPSLSNEMLVFMLAEDAVPVGEGGGLAEEGESIKRHVVPMDLVPEFLRHQEELGKLVDPKIYAALELYTVHGRRGQ